VGSSALGARAGGRCFGVAAGRRSRCQRTARQFRQTWTSPLQIDTGAALHALQKPSRVSVGAAGTGRWVHSGVWRYGELAGMSWQRSVPPMCSRRVKITMAGRKAIAAAVVSRTVLQASCIENRHRWGVVSGEAVAASLFVWPARQSACKRPRRSGAKSAQSTAVHLTKPWGRWTARSMTQVSCRIRPRCRPFCVWAVEKAPPTATQAGPSQ